MYVVTVAAVQAGAKTETNVGNALNHGQMLIEEAVHIQLQGFL